MNPWEKLKPPIKSEDIEEEAFSKSSKAAMKIPYQGKVRTAKRREEIRIVTVSNIFDKYLSRSIKILETYFYADPFYRDLIKLYFSEDDIKRILKRFRGLKKVIESIRVEYIEKIRKERDPERLSKLRREAQGRIASLIKDIDDDLEKVIRLYKYARRLPSLDLEQPVFIVAGPPNTGKSSLVKSLSSAKVAVASYPFTTKDVHVGHMYDQYITIQLIDTPGLLDRPLDKKNPIEMKAILALRHLPGDIIFLFDPSPERYYEPEKQINIFRQITELFKDKNIIPAINKIDYLERNVYDDLKCMLKKLTYNSILEISIIKKINLDLLKNKIIENAKKYYLNLSI